MGKHRDFLYSSPPRWIMKTHAIQNIMGKTIIFPYYGLWRKIYWIKKPTQFLDMGNKFPWISQCMGIFFTNSWKIDANHIFLNHGFWEIFPVLLCCSKSTIETPKRCVKSQFKVNNKDNRTTSVTSL